VIFDRFARDVYTLSGRLHQERKTSYVSRDRDRERVGCVGKRTRRVARICDWLEA